MEQNASSHLVPPTFSAESFSAQFSGINAAANNASPLLMSTLHLSGFSNGTAPFLPSATSQIALGGRIPADLANVANAAWSSQQQPWLEQAKVAAMLPMYGMLPQTVTSVTDTNMLIDPSEKGFLPTVHGGFDHDDRFHASSIGQSIQLQGHCSSTPSSASFDSRASPQRPCRVSSRVSSINVDSPALGSVMNKIPTAQSSQPPSNEQFVRNSPLVTNNHSNGSLPVTPACALEPFTSPPSTSKNYDLQLSAVSSNDTTGSHNFHNTVANVSSAQTTSKPANKGSDIASIFANAEDAHNSVPNMNASGHFTFDHHPHPSSSFHKSGGHMNGGIDHSTFDDLSWTKDINLDDFHLNYDTAADFHALLNADLSTEPKQDHSKAKHSNLFKADDFDKEFERHLNAVAKKDAKPTTLPLFDAMSSLMSAEIIAPAPVPVADKISLTPVQFTPPDSPFSDNGKDASNVPSTSGSKPSTLASTLETLSFLPKFDPSKPTTKVPVYKQKAQTSVFSFNEKEKQDKADAYNFSEEDENDDSPFGNLFSRDTSKDQKATTSAAEKNNSHLGSQPHTSAVEQSEVESSPPKSAVADAIRKRKEARALTSFVHAESLEEDNSVFVDAKPNNSEPNMSSPTAANHDAGKENCHSDPPPLPKLYIKIHRRDSIEKEKEKSAKKKKKKRKKHEKDHEWEGSDHHHKKKKKKKHKKDRERNDSSSGYEARLITEDHSWRVPSSSSDGQVFSRKRRLMMWNGGDADGTETGAPNLRKRLRMSTPTLCEVKKIDRFDEQWNPQLIKFSQAHGNLGKGTFVVNKQDLLKIETCSLWRVDNQNLLQKYPPIVDQKTGRTMYRNSSTYSGWCDQIAGSYLTVATKYMKHSRLESIVEPEVPLVDLFPATSEELEDRTTVSAEKPERADEGKEMLCFAKDSLRLNLQTYIQAMLNHALSLNFLQSIKQANEWNYLCSLNEIDKTNAEGKTKIKETVQWNQQFIDMVQQYSFCTVSDSDFTGFSCQACSVKPISHVVQLFSNEYYDYDTLVPKSFPCTGGESPLPAVEYLVCSLCQQLTVLYHNFHHMRYHLLKKCEEKIEAIGAEHPTYTAAEVIDACMKQTVWVKQTCDEHLNAWKKMSQLANPVDSDELSAGGSTESLNISPANDERRPTKNDEHSAEFETGHSSGASSPEDPAEPSASAADVESSRRSSSTDETVSSSCAKSGQAPDRASDFYPPDFPFNQLRESIPSRPYRTRQRVSKAHVACQTEEHPDFPRIPRNVAASPAPAMPSTADQSASNSDGTLRLLIQNFRNMTDTVRGPSKHIQNVPWRIMVMPRQHVVQKKGTQKCLGFFLQCCPEAYSDSWSCQAAAELRLISQKQGVPHFTRKTNHTYTAKENDWGYSCFMTWADILDENQGYIKEDNVILEVSVKAEVPKNILTQEQFGKKIQDYKRLADLQCSRGLIDKAIEVNASALKFCKDKDPERKSELESQKLKLIEMKLKESIERIEKDTSKGDEESSASNLNALKQAINATTTKSTRGNHKNHCSNKHKELRDLEKRSKTPPAPPNHAKKAAVQPPPAAAVPLPPEPVAAAPVVAKPPPPAAQKVEEEVAAPTDSPLLVAGQFNDNLLSNVRENRFKGAALECLNEVYRNDVPEDLQDADVGNFFSEPHSHFNMTEDLALDQGYLKRYVNIFQSEGGALPTAQELVNSPTVQKKLRHVYRPKDIRFNGDGDDELSSSESENIGLSYLDVPPGKKMRRDTDGRGIKGYPYFADIIDYAPNSKDSYCQTDFAPASSQETVEESVRLKPVGNVAESKVSGRPFAQPARKSTPRRSAAQKQELEKQEKVIPPIVDIYAGLPLRSSDDTAQKSDSEKGGDDDSKNSEDSSSTDSKTANDSSNTLDNGSIASTDSSSNSSTTSGSTSQTLAYNLDADSLNTFTMQTMPMEFAMDVYHNFTQHFVNTVASHVEQQQNDGKHKITMVDEATAHKLLNGNYLDDWVKANVKNHKLHQVITAMSIVSINCMNARRVVDKACEFLDAMETAAGNEEIRKALETLSAIANEGFEESLESTPESSPEREAPATPTTYADDPTDYALCGEEKRIDECTTVSKRYQQVFLSSEAAMIKRNVERSVKKIHDLNIALTNAKFETEQKKMDMRKLQDAHQKGVRALNDQIAWERSEKEKALQASKERKNEMKKLEKKAKAEAQLTIDLAAARETADNLTKENAQLQRKLNEEQLKYKRDTQSLSDSKKHIQAELSARDSEINKLSNQLDEKTQALKKAESLLANERKQNQSALNTAVERGKKAEVGLLEHKLEVGLQILERARDDCQKNVRELEETLKRIRGPTDIEIVRKSIGDWKAKKDEIIELISGTKTEFQTHIASIKGGKLLSQLPKIAVPKPPPGAPRIQLQLPQNSPLDKHPSVAAPGVIGSRPISQASVKSNDGTGSGGMMSDMPGSPVPKSTPPGNFGVKPMQTNPICLTPIGVRPSGYVNGTVITTPQRPQSTTNLTPSPASPSQLTMPGPGQPGGSISISPWPWSDPLQNYTETLLASTGRTFGPIGAEYAAARSMSMDQPSTSYNPAPGAPSGSGGPGAPGVPTTAMIRGRNGEWNEGNISQQRWSTNTMEPPMHNGAIHNGNVPNNFGEGPGTYGGRWSNSTWQGYHGEGPHPQPSDSRSESPLLRMNTAELKDEYFNHMSYLLPGASKQLLVEYFDRFGEKAKAYCMKNQGDVTVVLVEALTRSISLLLLENSEILAPLRTADTKQNQTMSSSASTAMSTLFEVYCHTLNRFAGCATPARKGPIPPRAEEAMVCAFCVMPVSQQQPHRSLKCMHCLHEKCFKDWTSKKQFCAVCGKRTAPDEFPELAK